MSANRVQIKSMDIQQAITNLQLLDAITKKDQSKIEDLLGQGADVNCKNLHDKNSTPLHYAVTAKSPKVIELLLDHGANSRANNDDGKSAFDMAAISPEIVQIFRDHEGECTSSTRSTVLTYFKRPGTASILGQWYESKLLALVLFRALHWERISSFYLATNVDDAGAFDDLVIRYTDGGIDRLVFLQAKHKLGKGLNLKDILESVGESGDFSLAKYFKSFLFIKLRCHESNQSVIFEDISDKTVVEFIIFTTLKLDYMIPKQFDLISRANENEEDSLFYTCPTGRSIRIEGLLVPLMPVASKWYKEILVDILARNWISSNEPVEWEASVELFLTSVKRHENSFKLLQYCYEKVASTNVSNEDRKKLNGIKPKICKLLETEKFKSFKLNDEDCITLAMEFLNKLRFYTEQSNEAEVEQIIKNEIPDHYPTSGDVNLIFQMYHLGVQRWWLQTGDVPFQTSTSQLFHEAKTQIEKGSLLENLHLISMGKLQIYKNELCPEKLGEALTKEVQRFVNDQNSHTLPIVGGLIESSCAKLVEYLKSKDEDHVNFKFVNTDVTNFNDRIGQLTSDGTVNDVLVFAHKGQIEPKVVDSLSRNFRKVILVTDKEMSPAVGRSSASCVMEYVHEVEGNLPAEDDQESDRNRRKVFLRNFRKSLRGLLSTAGEQLIDLNVNK